MPVSITHVIFDNDGLLLDTEGFYFDATNEIVGRYGKRYDWTLKSQLIGRKAAESARILIDALALPMTVEEYLAARAEILCSLFPQASLMPGVEILIHHLHDHGVKIAVASSSDSELYRLKITRHRPLFEIFDTVVLGDDPEVKAGKPAPDIFLLAAARLGADPTHCLVFEDSPTGITAAKRAGMHAIAVPDPHMDQAVYGEADDILTSLVDFQPEQWCLPPLTAAS